jgi:hypothetical protein
MPQARFAREGRPPRTGASAVSELLDGKVIDRPPVHTTATFKRAPRHQTRAPERQQTLRPINEDDDRPF